MALQVWLPLTKDLRNQGLSNIEVTNHGATFINTEADSTRTVAAGKLGGCYSFDASTYLSENSYDWSNFNVQNFSLCCWYKEPSPIASGNSQIIAIGTNSGWNNIRIGLLRRTSTGCPLFTVSNGSSAIQYACSTTSFPLNTWVHICCTYDQGKMKIYLNGILNTSLTTSIIPVLNSSQHLGVGAASNGAEKLTGYLNDVRIYDHCLSPKEVKEISKGLVLHYKMNGAIENSENLAPLFSHSLEDITEDLADRDHYWCDYDVHAASSTYFNMKDYIQILEDGWVHIEADNSESTQARGWSGLIAKDTIGLKVGDQLTVLCEFRNIENDKSWSFYPLSISGARFRGSGGFVVNLGDSDMIPVGPNGYIAVYRTATVNAVDNTEREHWLMSPCIGVSPGSKVSFDFRISFYKLGYTGPYRPYIEKNLLSNSDGPFTGIVPTEGFVDFVNKSNITSVSPYETYRFSFDAKASTEDIILSTFLYNNSSNITQVDSILNSQGYNTAASDGRNNFTLTTNYKRYWSQWTFNSVPTAATKTLLCRLSAGGGNTNYVGETVTVRNLLLEKISGDEPDCSGYNNNGQYTGTPILCIDTVRYDASTKLTAKFDYVRCGRGGMVSDGITVNMWIKCDAWGVNPISCTEGGGWNFENNGGYIQFACYVAGIGYKSVKSSAAIDPLLGGWHMLTGTYDGRYTKVYVDGVLKGSLDTGSDNNKVAYNAANAIFIGAEAGGNALAPATNSTFIGNISDVRIYATPLNEADILELYHTSASIDNQHNLFCGEVVE